MSKLIADPERLFADAAKRAHTAAVARVATTVLEHVPPAREYLAECDRCHHRFGALASGDVWVVCPACGGRSCSAVMPIAREVYERLVNRDYGDPPLYARAPVLAAYFYDVALDVLEDYEAMEDEQEEVW